MKFLLLLLLPCTLLSQDKPILFQHVNIVDVKRGLIVKNQDVLVEGNRIKKISQGNIDIGNKEVIEGAGKYLIPGLCDFNAYVLQYESAGNPAFELLLANGVTSVRDLLPPGSLSEALAIKKNIASRKTLGPRLYLSGKTLIDREPFQEDNRSRSILVTSVPDANRTVDSMIRAGVDVIDIRTILDLAILKAITGRAHKSGIKVLARYSGNWITASKNGVDAFTHPSDLWRVTSKGREKLFKFSADDSMRFVSTKDFYNRVLPSLGAVDTAYFYALIDTFKKNNTWICTNFAGHMPSRVKFEVGDTSRNFFRTAKQKDLLAAFLKNYKEITFTQARENSPQVFFAVLANKNGVPLLAGTQFDEFSTPGMSLHDELFWFVHGGLTPAEALRTATINPALFLNTQKDLGSIEVGKLADLVLLDANPLTDISNTRKINTVVANGRLLRRKDLDKLLEDAKSKVR